MRSSGRSLFAIAVVLTAALALLAWIQWRWIADLSDAEERRERRVLELAARQYKGDVERELLRVASAVFMTDEAEVPRRIAEWRASTREARLLKGAFILRGRQLLRITDRGEAVAVPWPPELEHVREVTTGAPRPPLRVPALQSEVPALILPVFVRQPRLLSGHETASAEPVHGDRSIEPAMKMMLGDENPEPEPRTTVMVRVPSGKDSAAHSEERQAAEHAQLHRPELLVIEFDRTYMQRTLFPEVAARLGGAFDVAVSDGKSVVYRSNPAWPRLPGDRADVVVGVLEPHGPAMPSSWRLMVRHHGGSVTALVAAARRRNIVLSGAVISLLAISFLLLAVIARRAERLRVQQLEFVAAITHELNTPLAALRSAGQNLADGLVAEAAHVARYGEAIEKEAARLGSLVAQVLDYSGLQARPNVSHASVDLCSVIDSAVEQTQWLAREKGVTVERQVPSGLPTVDGDADSLTRAVQNLVGNAIRYGGDGGWVAVRAEAHEREIAIVVEDGGPGIPSRDMPHLFEPFFRGHNSAGVRGSGLGLTIVQQIARAHGGRVTVDRHRTRGASFALHIPAGGQAVRHGEVAHA